MSIVAIAISGGVDSAVATARLKQEGHTVFGVHMRLLPGDDETFETQTAQPLRALAESLGIELYIADFRDLFRDEILHRCWDFYNHGRTPNPCVFCNRTLKFGKLLDFARAHGAEQMATGHYARIRRDEAGVAALYRGDDKAKDQTYFLLDLTQEQLSFLRMPLGELTKPEVRALAADYALPNAQKKESQDTCFAVEGEGFSESLQKMFNGRVRYGMFVNREGTVLGPHKGLHLYTLGQRKGLGLALGTPAYVCAIDEHNARVCVETHPEALLSHGFTLSAFNFQSGKPFALPHRCRVQVRYRSQPADCTVMQNEGQYHVLFDTQQHAVTPGQGAAFYDQDRLLGGGLIDRILHDRPVSL